MLLERLAVRAGITGFIAPGRWGDIQSAVGDYAILPVYVRTGDWARKTNQVFMDFFGGSQGTYMDIGANIGLTTIPVAQKQRVTCYSFEPDPVNFANLKANVGRNTQYGNVILYQLALLDRSGSVPFGLAEDGNLGDHRVVNLGSQRRTINVEAMALDDLNLVIEGKLGVKIDTQGAESAVIAGGKKTLKKSSLVCMEFSPFLIDQFSGDLNVIISFLKTFKRLAILGGESDEDLAYMPASAACEHLHAAFIQHRTNKDFYFDVYAEKDPQ